VGCDKKILWPSVGQQSGLIGTGWSSLALLGIHRQDLTEEVRAAESILQAYAAKFLRREALQILSGGAGASYREILAKPAEWYSANMTVPVADLGGSGAASRPNGRSHGGLPAPARELSRV
jgi:hypothetical protein